ncbi:GNAT family N-acetyltransferase [Ruegeria sp.]|uniref:GNAT family N-acetyltransferase n=1 Tax=Ruegeria sp. TaxID=1879320 RepID=UPI003C7BDB2F
MTQQNPRRATLADVKAIRDCLSSAYAEAIRDIPDLPDVTGGIEEDIHAHSAFVTEQDGRILGVIIFGVTPDAVMIFNLAVNPDAQGGGIARKLLDLAESAACVAGLPALRLRTHVQMQNTRAMYRHLGWHELEVVKNTVLMEKPVV